MKTIQAIFAGVLVAGLLFTGCSSSEEASKAEEQKDEEYHHVDREEDVVPTSDAPAEEVPIRERNAPVTKDPPAQPVKPASDEPMRTGLIMWSVQIGAFKNESGALQLVTEIKNKFNQPVYKDYDPVSGFYKVTLGSFQTREHATSFKAEVLSRGYPDAFTVEVRR